MLSSTLSKGIIYSVHFVVQVSALVCSLANNKSDKILIKVLFPERGPPNIKISKDVVAVTKLCFPKFLKTILSNIFHLSFKYASIVNNLL